MEAGEGRRCAAAARPGEEEVSGGDHSHVCGQGHGDHSTLVTQGRRLLRAAQEPPSLADRHLEATVRLTTLP